MNRQRNRKTVVVAGDVTIDWNIARVQRTEGIAQAWNADDLTRAFCQRGGAALLDGLIKAVAENIRKSKQAKVEVRQLGAPSASVSPSDERFHHSYAIWAPVEFDTREPGEKRKVWRVQQFLGLHRAGVEAQDMGAKPNVESSDPDIIVLDDAGLGFRDHPEHWPRAFSNAACQSRILLKMARPVARGALWDHLQANHADRLAVIMTADDLRRSQVRISRQVSWERTAQDLVWELLYNPHIYAMTRCAHIIVSFDTSGAILLSRKAEAGVEASLFFDPNVMEGEWGRHHRGAVVGYTSCLTAGIARELILNPSIPDISRGIQSGIRAMRFLKAEGYGDVGQEDPYQAGLAFPLAKIAAKLEEDGDCLAMVPIRNPVPSAFAGAGTPAATDSAPFWTILEGQYRGSLEQVARQVVIRGLEQALANVPVARFGNLVTVDRREIEALHSISSLISEYCEGHQPRPLSIAVFGPPGSGKTFAVSQVANSVRPGEIDTLSFNLSQFTGAEDLHDAFHRVRDRALSGKMPLVFWDEFDTVSDDRPLGWLRHFLAPMQDGEFQEGQVIHPIGACIFVFAGGTSHGTETFGANLDEAERRAVKLPDFVSRLKGFLNVLGPNREGSGSAAGRNGDPYYVIRRAIMLRTILERFTPQLFTGRGRAKTASIDEGVLRAFLLTREYKHGVRSMEALVAMSQLAGKTDFERSALPPEAQMDLHADGRDFMALVLQMGLDGERLEKLAEAAHDVFCDDLRQKGYQYGPVTSEAEKMHSSLKPYAELPEGEKEQNRNNVRDIPNKLANVGYAMLPSCAGEPPGEFSGEETERLAEMEHERWMKEQMAEGWKYAPATDKARKLHKDLLPWKELPESEKDKDRALVRGIPQILAKAGYIMVKLR